MALIHPSNFFNFDLFRWGNPHPQEPVECREEQEGTLTQPEFMTERAALYNYL